MLIDSTHTLVQRLGRRQELVALLAVLGLLLCIGLLAFDDYGISVDEPAQREHAGVVTYEYLGDVWAEKRILEYPESNPYGPVFSLSAVFVEKTLGLTDSRDIYMARHLWGFLFFFVATFFFYRLCKGLFGSWRLGLLGVALLVLSPRIFGHAFFNPKDSPFMALFLIAMYTLFRLQTRPSVGLAVLHGLATALAIDMRIAGVFVPALTGVVLGVDFLHPDNRPRRRALIAAGAVFLCALSVFVVLFWPRLWSAPVGSFVHSFSVMSDYPLEGTVLYIGDYVDRGAVPWHYIPLWVLLTTPLVHVVFFLGGLIAAAFILAGRSEKPPLARRHVWVILAWLLGPWLIVALRGSTLYDGWRHLYFIYPAFALLSLLGVTALVRYLRARGRGFLSRHAGAIIAVAVFLGLANTAVFMARSHPHQHVYFNALVGGVSGAKRLFDLDYWGTSYRQGLEYVLANDPSDRIAVMAPNPPMEYNFAILRPEERRRLVHVEEFAKAKYFLGNFKHHDIEYPLVEFGAIRVDGAKILGIYRAELLPEARELLEAAPQRGLEAAPQRGP
jgi:hypothetical protein